MDEIENLQLQCLCMKVMDINFKVVWNKGNINHTPDALSHNPIDVPSQQELLAESDEGDYQELSMAEILKIHQDGLDSIQLQELCKLVQEDTEYQ